MVLFRFSYLPTFLFSFGCVLFNTHPKIGLLFCYFYFNLTLATTSEETPGNEKAAVWLPSNTGCQQHTKSCLLLWLLFFIAHWAN